MALKSQYHPLAREFLGLLMSDKFAREDVAKLRPEHDEDRSRYHLALARYVNAKLSPREPLPDEAADDFHLYCSEHTEEFRKNIRAHTANPTEYMLACDGFGGKRCT
ncbi:MAG TPA: hypothetical protein VKT72_15915 [Candidatus Baltobacteraceae bacterium]|nr:hypothetical protein [Candidatus Baltobacteraceae bacterium]